MSYGGLIKTPKFRSVRESINVTTIIFTVCFIIVPQLVSQSFSSARCIHAYEQGKLCFLKLCQEQIIIYSLSLNTALTTEERKQSREQRAKPGRAGPGRAGPGRAEPPAPSAPLPLAVRSTHNLTLGNIIHCRGHYGASETSWCQNITMITDADRQYGAF